MTPCGNCCYRLPGPMEAAAQKEVRETSSPSCLPNFSILFSICAVSWNEFRFEVVIHVKFSRTNFPLGIYGKLLTFSAPECISLSIHMQLESHSFLHCNNDVLHGWFHWWPFGRNPSFHRVQSFSAATNSLFQRKDARWRCRWERPKSSSARFGDIGSHRKRSSNAKSGANVNGTNHLWQTGYGEHTGELSFENSTCHIAFH